jgi:hypothetical protein
MSIVGWLNQNFGWFEIFRRVKHSSWRLTTQIRGCLKIANLESLLFELQLPSFPHVFAIFVRGSGTTSIAVIEY